MRTIKISVIFSIVFLLHAAACNNEKNQSVANPESVRLNNKGFEFWNKYRCNNADISVLDSALFYFDKAIAEDENNVTAFWNKNSVLYKQKKYDELIIILSELLEKTDPKDYQSRATLNANLAQQYHQIGDSVMEQSTLLTAKNYYQLGLSGDLNETFIDDYILFTAHTEGKEAALLELEKYKNYLKVFIPYEVFKDALLQEEFNYY